MNTITTGEVALILRRKGHEATSASVKQACKDLGITLTAERRGRRTAYTMPSAKLEVLLQSCSELKQQPSIDRYARLEDLVQARVLQAKAYALHEPKDFINDTVLLCEKKLTEGLATFSREAAKWDAAAKIVAAMAWVQGYYDHASTITDTRDYVASFNAACEAALAAII